MIRPRDEIHDLLARYCRALDDRQLDDLRAVFSEDCVLTLQDGTVAHSGHDAVELLGARVEGAPRHRHLMSSIVVEIGDGTSATGTSDWYLMMPDGPAGWHVHSAGTYDDDFTRIDGTWLLSRRTIRPAPR